MMVSILGMHRRAEQFAAAVDGRTPFDQLPAELNQLAGLVGDLRAHEAPAPRADFAADLRVRLMAEAETVLTPVSPLALPSRRADRTRQRRLTAAAAVFTMVGGSAGLAAAAQQSVPGDALYPIKRGIEDAQLGFQSDDASKGRAYLDQATERLDEADSQLDDGAPSDEIAQSVDLFVVQAVAGSSLILDSFAEDGRTQDVEALRDFSAETLEQLQEVAETAPADIQDELARAAVVVRGIDQQANDACATCESRPALDLPVLMAQATQISQAMEALRSGDVDNDHPNLQLEVPKKSLNSNGQRSSGTESSADGPDDATDQGRRLSVDAELPTSPQQALEGLDEATGGLVGKVGTVKESTGKTVEQLEKDIDKNLDETLNGEDGLLN